jgi:hypothetical protein
MVEEEAVRACGAQAAQLLMLTPDEKFFWSPHQGMEARFHIQDVRMLSPPIPNDNRCSSLAGITKCAHSLAWEYR